MLAMEARLNSSGCSVREEKSSHEEGCSQEARNLKGVAKVPVREGNILKPSSPNLKKSGLRKEEEELELAKAEMGEVREENARLKMMLEQMKREYQSLHTRFICALQQEAAAQQKTGTAATPSVTRKEDENIEEPEPEPELVSLRLGRSRSPSEPKRDDNTSSTSKAREDGIDDDDEKLKGGLKLGLDYSLEGSTNKSDQPSPENSSEEGKEEEAAETWPPSKALKTMRNGDDDLSQQTGAKRARVSVRARCDTPTMNDGCQWRKYGQKIAKGNPCPRAYYRCTVAPACPVRKQVQRCAEDMSILITTYEGTHNHPLPISATAMASTTSAAASMLLSGSSTSQSSLGSTATAIPTTNLHGMTFNISDNLRSKPFYLPNSSSHGFQTITLDLTTSNNPSSHFNSFSSTFSSAQRFPSASLSFSSLESSMVPTTWGNGYPNYASPLSNKNHSSSLNLGTRPSQQHFYQPFSEKNNQPPSHQQVLTETLTKAITSDPSFHSAIAAAISSMVGSGGGTQGNQGGEEQNLGQKLKWGEPIKAISSNPVAPDGKGCASSYLTRTSASNTQTGGLMLLQQPPLPFSVSKTSTTSKVDNGDQLS